MTGGAGLLHIALRRVVRRPDHLDQLLAGEVAIRAIDRFQPGPVDGEQFSSEQVQFAAEEHELLALTDAALCLIAAIATITLFAMAIYRGLVAECFDPGFLRAIGISGPFVHLIFLALVVLNLVPRRWPRALGLTKRQLLRRTNTMSADAH